jgi:hypothetical protein
VDLTQSLYQAFSPEPLTPDQVSLYVDLNKARGRMDVVQRLSSRIRLSNQPVSQVLAGHKGSGKSTELMRLQAELQRDDNGKRYFTVLIKAEADIDKNDVDFPDVLIALIRQLATQLRERESIQLKPGYFSDRWERIKGLLGSEVDFGSMSLDAGMLKISSTIKSSPDAREKIRALLEPDTNNWLMAANEVIQQANAELAKKGYDGLVALVDDLDKMIIRPKADAGCSTAEYLFVHRAAQLTAFACHTVYTLPLSLAYSHHEQTIKSNFGAVPVVPMVKISTPPPKSKSNSTGISSLRDVVKLRCEAAGAEIGQLFNNDRTQTEIIKLSGGQPSELMAIIQDAILASDLPIGAESLARVRRERERSYARTLRRGHWPILEEVRETGWYQRSDETENLFRELIDSRAILQYVNDREWYALNPMVANLEPPRQTSEG